MVTKVTQETKSVVFGNIVGLVLSFLANLGTYFKKKRDYHLLYSPIKG